MWVRQFAWFLVSNLDMKTTSFVFFFLFCLYSMAFSQKETKFSLKGNVKGIIGTDTVPAYDLLLTLNNTGHTTNTRKNGNFRLKAVKKGNYHLQIINNGFDTLINLNSNKSIQLNIKLNCQRKKEDAIKDIEQHTMKLLLIGGDAPIVYTKDQKFSEKYKISFYDYGCLPDDYNCILSYNKAIFSYLDEKYGKGWRDEVRNDVIGL